MVSVQFLTKAGDCLSVVNSARVSFSKESDWLGNDDIGNNYMSEKDVKLLDYLARHNHKSPFNHVFASFRVKAPVFVARQLVKHKFLPWNETSRRYVDEKPEFFMPDYFRAKSTDKKQGSSENRVYVVEEPTEPCYVWYDDDEAIDTWVTRAPEDVVAEVYNTCQKAYDTLISSNVCPEQARMVLPQGMMTEWIWSGTLGAFGDMCKLRLKNDTQKETREVATLISEFMETNFPYSWKAYMRY